MSLRDMLVWLLQKHYLPAFLFNGKCCTGDKQTDSA